MTPPNAETIMTVKVLSTSFTEKVERERERERDSEFVRTNKYTEYVKTDLEL